MLSLHMMWNYKHETPAQRQPDFVYITGLTENAVPENGRQKRWKAGKCKNENAGPAFSTRDIRFCFSYPKFFGPVFSAQIPVFT